MIYFLAAYHTAIPFTGFGFLDNAIMIIAVSIAAECISEVSLSEQTFIDT